MAISRHRNQYYSRNGFKYDLIIPVYPVDRNWIYLANTETKIYI